VCKPASFVIADNGKRAFWSLATDSHEVIIAEYNLVEMVANKVCIVRVEIVPPDDDMTKPLRQWIYNKDQDILPEWYDPKSAEKLCRLELKKWFAAKVFVKGIHEVSNGIFWAWGNSQVTACGNSRVTAWGNSQVTARENSQVTAWENSTTNQLSSTAKVIVKENAVVIDRTGLKPVCHTV
jgi:hypothetical protein